MLLNEEPDYRKALAECTANHSCERPSSLLSVGAMELCLVQTCRHPFPTPRFVRAWMEYLHLHYRWMSRQGRKQRSRMDDLALEEVCCMLV